MDSSPTEKLEAELARKRCRCCLTLRQARALVWITFGCALLAYTGYALAQMLQSRERPTTTSERVKVDEVFAPGLIICPLDSPRPDIDPSYEPQRFVLIHQPYICTVGTPGTAELRACNYRYFEYRFKSVDTRPRICLDIPPGASLKSIRDLVNVNFQVAQTLDPEGMGSPYNGLYYGFYAEDTDKSRNDSVINLANAGGITVIAFAATEYVPLRGESRRGFDVVSVASAGLLLDGVVDLNDTGIVNKTSPYKTRFFGGQVYVAAASMDITKTSEIWAFDVLQMLGAIGGIYGLLKGLVISMHGESNSQGLLRRYFYKPTGGAGPSGVDPNRKPTVAAAAAPAKVDA